MNPSRQVGFFIFYVNVLDATFKMGGMLVITTITSRFNKAYETTTSLERLMLNAVQRMSGIASLTSKVQERWAAQRHGSIILDVGSSRKSS